jgi:glutamine synthetase
MNPCMSIFAPHPESYDRFLHTVNAYLVCPTASNVPATVSWGTNNRTVAVRLPPKPSRERHIEHRVSGSDADVTQAIAAVLAGIHYGLKEKSDPGPPVYGDASLPQYGLPKLVTSLEEAITSRDGCAALKAYF